MRNAIRSKYSSGMSLNARRTYLPRRLILTYLIPCHLLTTHTLPTLALLSDYPHLQTLFLPLSRCIKKGDLSGFDAALIAGEDQVTKRRLHLNLVRERHIGARHLF